MLSLPDQLLYRRQWRIKQAGTPPEALHNRGSHNKPIVVEDYVREVEEEIDEEERGGDDDDNYYDDDDEEDEENDSEDENGEHA